MTTNPGTATLNERQFLDDVLTGLAQPQKCLPSKYFYDRRGSQIFEQICALDEYYLTRTETAILERYSGQIVDAFHGEVCVIEPGAGAGTKAAILLAALNNACEFVPLEISTEALQMAGSYLSERFPDLALRPVHGDFTDPLDVQRVSAELDGERARLVFFPGSTLGNFDRSEAVAVLSNLRRLAGKEGCVVLGLDMLKEEQRLLAAYDDGQGITAEFNKNLLQRINNELGADFDCDNGFEHRALFNAGEQRIEMHLVATRQQTVTIGTQAIEFEAGETIHTESSHKYSLPVIERLCADADLQIDRHWTDAAGDFGVFRLRRAA